MLIGPTVTLDVLEEHMNDKVYEIKNEIVKLRKELMRMQNEFPNIARTITNENGEEVTNPDFIQVPKDMAALEEKIKDLIEQQEFMEAKLVELENIEERSVGNSNIKKSEYKITLTLNDCLKLGIEPEKTK